LKSLLLLLVVHFKRGAISLFYVLLDASCFP